jgi:hypothetical protein
MINSMTRDEINLRQNKFLLLNWERLETQKKEISQPTMNRGKKKRISVIETARQLYDSGKTHKEIGLLLGVSISTAGRFVRQNHQKRKY